jgi:hypothetical protein
MSGMADRYEIVPPEQVLDDVVADAVRDATGRGPVRTAAST